MEIDTATLFELASQARACMEPVERPLPDLPYEHSDSETCESHRGECKLYHGENFVLDLKEGTRVCTLCGACENDYLIEQCLQDDSYDRCGYAYSITDNDVSLVTQIDTRNSKLLPCANRIANMNKWGTMSGHSRQHLVDLVVLHSHGLEMGTPGSSILKHVLSKKCLRGRQRKAMMVAAYIYERQYFKTTRDSLLPSSIAKKMDIPTTYVKKHLKDLEEMIAKGEIPVPKHVQNRPEEITHSTNPIDYVHTICDRLELCGMERKVSIRIRKRSREIYECILQDTYLERRKPNAIMSAIISIALREEGCDTNLFDGKFPVHASTINAISKYIHETYDLHAMGGKKPVLDVE